MTLTTSFRFSLNGVDHQFISSNRFMPPDDGSSLPLDQLDLSRNWVVSCNVHRGKTYML